MADVRVNLAFTADTSQAISAVQKLQQTLSQLSASGVKGTMTKEMEQASAAAKELSYHLNQAFNAKTGNFDLSRLDRSLKASGTNVDALSTKLLGAGQQGQQAFIQLAQSISLADRPMITLSSRLTGLFTTLKNTAKWQISSTILHGFMGAVQQAYGYAQDLNESLNNIRIVTGYDTDKMAQFAQEANKAAKALSTTTTAYTDASLIYYQQGLGDKEVKERTDVTVKLANVSRQSAEEVSSQMTAIWNNFDDGSKSLEYYADAITALGAKTASSSAEIAEGLQKFAAVSETVGLSYEYATSALATVVAQTRQSADTVGTAFKTMFARIQGLKLGETLEDGTTFNQYSEALYSIGVNIKDANGNLKDMDDILDEMGAKWKDLNRDEQVAVAQKVAGIRQYQQMISLMDNYDIFKENIDVAGGSTGTLQRQADIYAESWEAASKRVKASAQALYSDLLDDSFFIKMSNGLSGLLDSIDAFIDGIGGIGPLITGLGSILLGVFANKIPEALNNLKANFNILFHGAANEARTLATEMSKTTQSLLSSSLGEGLSEQNRVLLQNTVDLTNAKNQYSAVSASMTTQEKTLIDLELSLIQAQQKEAGSLAEKIDKRLESIDALSKEIDLEKALSEAALDDATKEKEKLAIVKEARDALVQDSSKENLTTYESAMQDLRAYREEVITVTDAFAGYTQALYDSYVAQAKATNGMFDGETPIIDLTEALGAYVNKLHEVSEISNSGTGNNFGQIKEASQRLAEVQDEITNIVGTDLPGLEDAFANAFKTAKEAITSGTGVTGSDFRKSIEDIIEKLTHAKIPAEDLRKILTKLGMGSNLNKVTEECKKLGQEQDKLRNKIESINKALGNFNPSHVVTGVEALTKVASGLGSTAMLISSFKSAITALNNEDLSFGEKLTTLFMSISMGAGAAISTLKNFTGVIPYFTGLADAITAVSASQEILNGTTITSNAIKQANIAINEVELSLSQKKALAYIQEGIAERGMSAQVAAGILVKKLGIAEDKAAIIAKQLKEGATLKEALAEAGLTTTIGASTVVKIADTAATWMMNAAMAAFGITLSPIIALILAFVAALAAIVLVVTGVVLAVKTLSDAYNADAIAAKKAQETANELAEGYDNCKEHYQDMINTMSQYKEARKSLEELTKGTDEYKEALQKANRAAQELIANNPNSFKPGDYKFENGELTINEDALERAEQNAQRQESTMYGASQIANANASEAQAKSKQTNLIRDILDDADTVIYARDKSIVEQAINAVKDNSLPLTSKEDLASSLDIDPNGMLVDALWDNRNGLEDCAQASRDAALQYDLATQAAVQELLSFNDKVQDSDRGEDITNAVAESSKEYYEAEKKALEDQGWGTKDIAQINGANDKAKEIFAEYAKTAGLEGVTLTDTKGSDKNRRFVYTTAEGDKKEVSLEAMREVMATARADDKMDDVASALAEYLTPMDDYIKNIENNSQATEEDKVSAGLIKAVEDSMLKQDFSDLNHQDTLNLQSLISSTEGGTEGLFKQMFGEDLKSTAIKFGYDSAEEWISSFNETLHNAQVDWKTLLADLPAAIQNISGIDSASADTYTNLKNTYSSAEEVGKGNGNKVMSNIDSVVDTVDTSDQGAVLDTLSNIDWSQWDAAEQAKQAIYELGITDAPKAAEQIDKIAEKMQELNGAVKDLDDLNLELDSDVDAEEYEALAEYLKTVAESSDELSDSLKYNDKEAKKVSESILRFDKAIEKVDKNYEDWAKTMKSGSLQDQAKMATELKDAYADMLDIDVRSLSDDFVMNADNLELMKKAAEGSEEAYNQLQAAVQEDILVHCDIDKSAFDAAKSDLDTALNELNFKDIEIGADLNSDAALNAMTDLVNAAGMTAQQATDYLASMGVDAEVETVKVSKPSTTETVDIVPEETPGTAKIPIIAADGTVDSTSIPIPTIKYKGVKHETPAESDEVATSLKVTSAHKSSGGGFKHKNSNLGGGTGGGKGKSCFVAGTQVSLGQLFKNIEDIQINDIVLSYNEQTHKNEYSKVLQTMIHYVNEEIYDLYIEDEVLSVTGIHRFYIKQNNFIQWVAAQNLQIGDNVLFADGTWHEIKNIKVSIKLITVYNFEVANNHNYYVGQNQILAHNKGGGGGGGGKSNPAEKKQLTKKSDVVDRYKQINDKLNTVNKNMDKYNKLSDMAYGKNKLKSMDKILNAYKQQIKLQQQLKKEAEGYLPEDKKNMEAAAADLGTRKLQYDSDGNVKNIEAVQSDIFAKINAAETKYNSFATKEQQDEYNKATLEPLMKQYEEFKNYVSKYEDTKQQIADAEAAEMDAQIEYLDKKLDVVGKKRQIRMDVRDSEIKMFERELEKLNDQAFVTAERIALLTATMKALDDEVMTERNSAKAAILQGVYFLDKNGNPKKNKDGTLHTLGDTQKYSDMNLTQLLNVMSKSSFWDNHNITETAAEQLKTTLDSLNDLDQSFDDLKEKIDKQLIETFEHWTNVMQRHLNTMEHLVNMSGTWVSILEEVGKVNLGWTSQQMNEYRQKTWSIQKDAAAADRDAYDMSYEMFKSAKEGFDTIAQDKKNEAAKKDKEAQEHGNNAVSYENKINKIQGTFYTQRIEKKRETRKIVQDKLANPEKYYGDKNYFTSSKEGQAEKTRLEEKDKKLEADINQDKVSYKKSIEYKREIRNKVQKQIEEEEKKLQNAKTDKEKKSIQATIDKLKEKDALYKNQINNLKAQQEEYRKLADAEIDLQSKMTDEAKGLRSEITALTEDLETMREEVRKNREKYLQDLLDLIQLSKENLAKYLDDVMKDFEQRVSGVYGSIEGMQEAFDQNKQISERYLQDTEKVYQLTKMNRDIEKKMDETTNLKAKEKLAKFQEDMLKYAKEGIKMSEYDLEVMQKKYDLEVAKIALEESQNAKTQVRLTRDAEGNYSYTYTADENKTAEAEQGYEDKLNDLIKYNNEYQLQMQEAILNTEKAEADAIDRLRQAYENSEITLDQFYAQAEQAHAFYKSQMQYYAQENEKASENSMHAFVTEYDAYYSVMDKKVHVNQTFSDDTRKTYEQVHQIYQDAAINRDKALYDEELAYRESYNRKAAELKQKLAEGKITQEEADKELAELARAHSNELDGINKTYTNELEAEVTLQNGTRLGASEYFQALITGDKEKNSEVLEGMLAANKGFILDTNTEFLPGLGTAYEGATKTISDFANKVTDGQGDNDGTTLLGQMKQGMQEHETNVTEAEKAIKLVLDDAVDPYDTLADTATKDLKDIDKKAKETSDTIDKVVSDGTQDMSQAVDDVKNWYEQSKPYWNKAKKKIENITTALTNMLAVAAGIKPIKVDVDTAQAVANINNLTKAYKKLNNAKGGGSGDEPAEEPPKPEEPAKPSLNIDSKVKLKQGKKLAVSAGGPQNVTPYDYITDGSTTLYVQATKGDWVHLGTTKTGIANRNTYVGWVKKTDIQGFDTGGYTGQWGAGGRWALLHQKELILNAKDTENMLAAVKTVREIAAMVDLQAQQANLAGQYALALGQLPSSRSTSIDQNVHITAEFPNVQDHNEVELAITSLVNRASQFAWRN